MESSRTKPTQTSRSVIVFAFMLPLLLASCSSTGEEAPTSPSPRGETEAPSAAESQPDAAQPSDADSGSATFQIADESFEFSLTTCLIREEDILAQGPGSNTQDGGIAFLDVDFTQYDGDFVGGADIELGTDRPITSPDDFYRLDPLFNNEGFEATVNADTFVAEGMFVAHGQTSLPVETANSGTLTVSCAAP
ncbi:MAG: hypothetical protein Q4G35_01545 [Propionibacteriaceae bacterium]|nr:hypothetical protein [Propionibacteriaceae bacterium]